MIIRSKAPFRMSFGGGGTDMPPYCTEQGGCVISTTIDRFIYLTLEPREDKRVSIYSINKKKEKRFDIDNNEYKGESELFKGVFNVLRIKDGFTVYKE